MKRAGLSLLRRLVGGDLFSDIPRAWSGLLSGSCLLCATCWPGSTLAAKGFEAPTGHEKRLAEAGIPETAEGLIDYLRQLHPGADQRAEMLALVRELGSDSFSRREAATARLMAMPLLDTEALAEAVGGDDPEVRTRGRKILANYQSRPQRLLHAVFKSVQAGRVTEAVPEVLAAIPLCRDDYIRHAARGALIAASRPAQAELLTTAALTADNEPVRVAATMGLDQLLGNAAEATFESLLRDRSEAVRLAAARAMANFGSRASLPALLKLLDSGQVEIRAQSAAVLRSLTGEHVGFAAYESAGSRAQCVRQWERWIAAEGPRADLHFPLQDLSHLHGNTLLAYGSGNKVVELDDAGKEVWSHDCVSPWYAEKLPSGNVLITENSADKVVEVDREGRVVWEYPMEHPYTARMLASGNVLISSMKGMKVLEVNRKKEVVWEYRPEMPINDAHRLPDGTTLLSVFGDQEDNETGGVRVITPAEEILWEYEFEGAYGCQPLDNGNVLISNVSGKVVEVTPGKEIVWRFQEKSVAEAFRLPDGNTLITGYRRFVEIAPDKGVVWEKAGETAYGSAQR